MPASNATSTSYIIPSRPQILIEVTEELRSDAPNIDKISTLIKQDVALYSSVIATVNSAFYGFKTEINSIKHAVTLLGIKQVFNIIRLSALKNSLATVGPIERFWDTATEVATICAELSTRFTNCDSDEAYTLGMLHDIGIPLLLLTKPEFKDFLRSHNGHCMTELYQQEQERFSVNHYDLGAELIRKWNIGERIARAIELQPHYITSFKQPVDQEEEVRFFLCLLLLARDISDEYRHFWRLSEMHKEEKLELRPALDFLGISDFDYKDLKEDIVNKLTDET